MKVDYKGEESTAVLVRVLTDDGWKWLPKAMKEGLGIKGVHLPLSAAEVGEAIATHQALESEQRPAAPAAPPPIVVKPNGEPT